MCCVDLYIYIISTPLQLHLQATLTHNNNNNNNNNTFCFITTTKMARSHICAVAAAAIAILLLTSPHVATALTCGDVASSVAPCLSYARSGQGSPPAACCSGVKSLNSRAATTADRQTACNCLKNLAKSMSYNAGTVAAIPGKCHVNVPFPISTSTDCSKYGFISFFGSAP
jgi:Protease inhibitor/seed storage/LTP family